MLVDSHAHLDMGEFAVDLPAVIDRAAAAGVGRILTVGIDLPSSRAALALADRFPMVWAAVGVHPHDAGGWDGGTLAQLAALLDHPKAAAVGETGLDFYRNRAPAGRQEAAFRDQLALAASRGLPVVIHSRDAHRRTGEILRESPAPLRGVMHCFSGTADEARGYLGLGLKISLAGPLTYPNAAGLREVAARLPAESFLVETDCPYLPPQGHRGRRNEPALVCLVAAGLARAQGLSDEDAARITTGNAREVFGLGLEVPGGEITYRIRRSLYLNVTNRCPNACVFCRRQTDPRVKGHNLLLAEEPSASAILEAVRGERDFDEAVFCGYGEPLLRLDLVEEVSRSLKAAGHPVRVNTNGLASLVLGLPVPQRLAGLVDSYSVSLNAPDAATYARLCRPSTGEGSFAAVLEFIRQAREAGAGVTATAVALPGADIEACRRLASSLGAGFRVRKLDEVG